MQTKKTNFLRLISKENKYKYITKFEIKNLKVTELSDSES